MSKTKCVLLVLAGLGLVFLAALVVLDYNYDILFSSARVSHDTLVKPETRALVSVDPVQARSLLGHRLGIPAWTLRFVLPYEGALVCDVDYARNTLRLAALINERRLGPVICDLMNSARLPAPFDKWFNEKMKFVKRGELVRHGTAPLDPAGLKHVRDFWPGARVPAPLTLEGGHLLEAALDNRDGSAFALISTLAAARGQNAAEAIPVSFMGAVVEVASVRVCADMVSPNAAKVRIRVDCQPDADSAMVQTVRMLIDLGYGMLQPRLQARKVRLEGQSAVQGNVVEGNYTLTGIEAMLAAR